MEATINALYVEPDDYVDLLVNMTWSDFIALTGVDYNSYPLFFSFFLLLPLIPSLLSLYPSLTPSIFVSSTKANVRRRNWSANEHQRHRNCSYPSLYVRHFQIYRGFCRFTNCDGLPSVENNLQLCISGSSPPFPLYYYITSLPLLLSSVLANYVYSTQYSALMIL